MKAWTVRDKECECGSEIIYAETRGKAISYALEHCEIYEDCKFTDLCARRFKAFDKYYEGHPNPDFWFDDEKRIILVRDFGWSCDECYEAERCTAHEFCAEYRAYLNGY